MSMARLATKSWLLLVPILLTTFAGCGGFTANLVRVVRGYDFPAEYRGLEGKRVAVIAATERGICSDPESILLSRFVRTILNQNVDEIELVSQEDVDRWLDDRGWEDTSFVEIAKAVQADQIVVLEIENLKLQENSTLYQGSSTVTVSAYDVERGDSPTFRKHLPDYTYPQSAGIPVIEKSEDSFRRMYLMQLAKTTARYFHNYDLGVDVATDAELLSY